MSKCTYSFYTSDNVLNILKLAFFSLNYILELNHFNNKFTHLSAAWYSIEWMNHSLSDQLHIDEHLSCFQSFAITNNAVMTCLVHRSLYTYVSNQQDKFLEVELFILRVYVLIILISVAKLLYIEVVLI